MGVSSSFLAGANYTYNYWMHPKPIIMGEFGPFTHFSERYYGKFKPRHLPTMDIKLTLYTTPKPPLPILFEGWKCLVADLNEL